MRNSQVGDLLVATTEVDGSVLNRSVCLLVYEDEETAVGVMLNRPMQVFQASVSGEATDQAQGASNASSHRLSQFMSSEQPAPEPYGTSDLPSGEHLESGDAASDDEPPTEHSEAYATPADELDAGKLLVGKSLYFGGPLSGPVVAVHGQAHLAEAEAGEGIFVAAQRDHLEALLQNEQPVPFRLIVGHLSWTPEQLSNEIAGGVWHRVRATNEILSTADERLWPRLIRSATSGSVSRWLGTKHVADAHLLN